MNVGIRGAFGEGQNRAEPFLQQTLPDRSVQAFLAPEMIVYKRLGNAGGAGNLPHGGSCIPFLSKQVLGGIHEHTEWPWDPDCALSHFP